MSTIVRAAAVQTSPVLYSRRGTVDKIIAKIRELGELGVQFATLPETIVPYYPYFSFVQSPYEIKVGKEHQRLLDESVTIPSAETRAIGEVAKRPTWSSPSVSTSGTAAPSTTASSSSMPTARCPEAPEDNTDLS